MSHDLTLTCLAAAVLALVAGAVAAVLLPNNRTRVLGGLVSQALGSALVLCAVLPVCFGHEDLVATYEWAYPVGTLAIRIGPLSAFFLAWSLPLTFLGSVYARGYLAPWLTSDRNLGVHFALLNLIALSFVIIYSVENALLYLLGWEIAAISAWLLVIWDHRQQSIRFAGFNYLVSTHVGLTFLVAAFMLMFAATRSLDFAAFSTFLRQPGELRSLVFVLLCTSFALKSAFYPFHSWLPRAHAAAPAHVSALMSGVIHKAGLFGLLKFTQLLGRPEEWMGWGLLAFGGLSAVMGVLQTTSQRDLKRLLGYSSTENVGIAMMGVGVGYLGLAGSDPWLVTLGFSAAVLHILNHALFKCVLFFGAGAVYRATHTVELEHLGGLAKTMPFTATVFLVAALAAAGMPLFNGFVSEWLLFSALLAQPATAPALPLLLAATTLAFVGAVSALSFTRCFGVAFLGAARHPHHVAHHDAPSTMAVAMAVPALGIVALGLLPPLGLHLVEPVTASYLQADTLAGLRPRLYANFDALLPFTLGTAAAICVLAGLRRWRSHDVSRHVTWGCGYETPTPRMQYGATSFALPFLSMLASLLPHSRTEKGPSGAFPTSAQVATYYFDAAERRIFRLLRSGEVLVERTLARLPDRSTDSFSSGLLVLLVVAAWLVWESTR